MESISTDVWTPAFNMRDLSGHKSKPAGSDKDLPPGSTEHVSVLHSGHSIGMLIS